MTEEQNTMGTIEEEEIIGFVREEESEAPETVEEPVPPASLRLQGDVSAVEGEVVQEEPIDEVTALQQQVAEAQAQADEYLDDLRRERAAFQNFKKRRENERADLRQMAQSSLLMQILPAFDDFERAIEAIPEDQAKQSWVEGITLIQRKLQSILETVGVVEIDAQAGRPFDPFFHEAVTYEDHDEHQEGEIIDVVQKGYKMGERVLRPTMVRVAK